LPFKSLQQKRFTYGKAVNMVLKAFEDFDPKFRNFAERVFRESHVDSQIRKHKQGGAFCSSVTPKISPYVLLNFGCKLIDVSTMAHEFGHSIHSLAGCVSLCRNAAK
jgi:oligoendopeptidase F